MNLNSDVNVLGSLQDFSLVKLFLADNLKSLGQKGGLHSSTGMKTVKSIKRFEKAISGTLLTFKTKESELLVKNMLENEGITADSLLLLFWNASANNELLNYLNNEVYFTAFYSGRLTIKQDEVIACLKDLKERENELKKWSDSTLYTTASKYLTLLKKFNLMEGTLNKKIIHPYLNDKMFVSFIYWLCATEVKSNLLESEWLKYSFFEKPVFIERLMQKKFSRFFNLLYTGDKLTIETLVPYPNIYHAVK